MDIVWVLDDMCVLLVCVCVYVCLMAMGCVIIMRRKVGRGYCCGGVCINQAGGYYLHGYR